MAEHRDRHLGQKRAVVERLGAVLDCPAAQLQETVAAAYAPTAKVHGSHPINDCNGADSVAASLWQPLRNALPDLERRNLIVASGEYDGHDLVCAYALLQGTFTEDLFGIPASGGAATLRCCEIHRMADDAINESYVLLDFLDLMRQAGCWPLAPCLGSAEQWPGPATNDGVNLARVDDERGAESIALVHKMHRGLWDFDGRSLSSMNHAQYWTPNFMWYGPAGIGTTRGLRGFEAHHQLPFLRAFPDRGGGTHVARIGDGDYAVTGGWPSLEATHTGGDWLGVTPSGRRVEMRVMDFYRIDGDLIAENWVPIDVIHMLLQMGIDVFARLRHLQGAPDMSL